MQLGNWKSGCVPSGSHNSSNNKDSATGPYSLIQMRLPETEFSPAQLHMLCSATESKEEVSLWRKRWSQWSWYSSAANISYFVCFNQRSHYSKTRTLTTEHYSEQIGLFVAITIHWCKQRLPKVSSYESGRRLLLGKSVWWKRGEEGKAFYLAKDMKEEKQFSFILKRVFSYSDRYKTTKEIQIQRKD